MITSSSTNFSGKKLVVSNNSKNLYCRSYQKTTFSDARLEFLPYCKNDFPAVKPIVVPIPESIVYLLQELFQPTFSGIDEFTKLL